MTSSESRRIEIATPHDAAAIDRLACRSILTLHRDHYDEALLRAAVERLYGADHQLLRDGTYFVVRSGDELAAAGGWSWRSTILGAHGPDEPAASALDPTIDPARIRGFYVDPDHVGSGLGSTLLEFSETAARAAGFSVAALTSTLPAVGFYRHHGYEEGASLEVPVRDGNTLTLVRMRKRL